MIFEGENEIFAFECPMALWNCAVVTIMARRVGGQGGVAPV